MIDTDLHDALTVAVAGTGHLGQHHVRLAASNPAVRFLGAYDRDRDRLEAICSKYGAAALPDLEAAARADAVIVATPTVTHREVAGFLLDHGCHVLVEKPVAATVAEAEELVDLAARNGTILAVGHVEFHNPAVHAALKIASGVRYLEAQRLSPFTARSVDVDVILDLMIHDIQITLAVAGEQPSEIRAVGVPVLTDKVDLCHGWVEFPSGLVANLTASRVSAERVRKLRLFAQDSYFSIDYADQTVHSARLQRGPAGVQIVPQHIDVTPQEPLAAEQNAFFGACRGETAPIVDGAAGAAALAVAIEIRERTARR